MSLQQKTYSATPEDINAQWWIVDAQDIVLGRMAAEVAKILRGKHKPTYTPHMDDGDHVIIINADKVHLTGVKQRDKTYYRHTGYPGGIRSVTAGKLLAGEFPERVVHKAVQRMITRNPLGRKQMSKLHIYAGDQHPHEAQQPKLLDLAAKNDKNSKR